MSAIKEKYDEALHGALKASAENMSMRTQLAEAEERKVTRRLSAIGERARRERDR
jgi:hypothetical protein